MQNININTNSPSKEATHQFSPEAQYFIDENKRVLDNLDKQAQLNSVEISEIMQKLQQLAVEGREDIYNGNSWRNEVEDVDFSEVVPQSLEPVVLHVMIASKEWDRTCNGFYWRRSREFAD